MVGQLVLTGPLVAGVQQIASTMLLAGMPAPTGLLFRTTWASCGWHAADDRQVASGTASRWSRGGRGRGGSRVGRHTNGGKSVEAAEDAVGTEGHLASNVSATPACVETRREAGVPPSLQVAFCPDPGRGCFTTTFDAQPAIDSGIASVNAGSHSLRVGGTGLNGQFERDLQTAGHRTNEFQRLHQCLMRLAQQSPGVPVAAPAAALERHGGLLAAVARCSKQDGAGFVAVDVFAEAYRPLHQANTSMVYCVGPDRRNCRNDDEFLEALEDLGEGVLLTCVGYNELASARDDSGRPSLPQLERVRMGLVSGGKYAGRVSKAVVARALLLGLSRGAAAISMPSGMQDITLSRSSVPVFEFAFDEGIFEKTWHELHGSVCQ
mmetsp:Transcript_56471/g.108968  ORF Transcript_56471/g.108968 Transcript_56471/m.108968 type:complete len:379 (-) Transcript_56471:74-1210(-)